MPFRSKSQQRLMFARHPKIAKRWAEEHGVPKDLPEKKKNKKRKAHPALDGLRRARS